MPEDSHRTLFRIEPYDSEDDVIPLPLERGSVANFRLVARSWRSVRYGASAVGAVLAVVLCFSGWALGTTSLLPWHQRARTGAGAGANDVQLADRSGCFGSGSVGLNEAPGQAAGANPCKPPSVLPATGSGIVDVGPPSTTHPPGEKVPSLFCFIVTLTWGDELGLVRAQYQANASIFSCDAWDVFSIDPVSIGPGSITKAIPGGPAVWKQAPGSAFKQSLNTNVFLRAWRALEQDGRYRSHDWVIKIDADTVFLPDRLRRVLGGKAWSWTMRWQAAVYVKNCWKFKSMQGPLEIISRAAVEKFGANVQQCQTGMDWMNMGEDQFMDKCLHRLGVQSVNNFEVLSDAYCSDDTSVVCNCAGAGSTRPGVLAFHPCKTVQSYFGCMGSAGAVVAQG